ncbi:MAG: LuxR C-terminal-related transcriptional regulator, partial [Dehalococcoidia bacterium]
SIPEGVREVIGQRLNRLSEGCNQALTTASVIGRQFDFPVLNSLTEELSEDQLLRVIDEALSSHMIEELPGMLERYRFSHTLIQQTLSEELSTSRKVRMHARIGEELEGLYESDPAAHANELAFHFAEAEPVIGTEKLVRYSLLAGHQALEAYAYEAAMAQFQRALEAKAGQALDADTAALLFGLGRSQVASLPRNEMHLAFSSLSQAFDYHAEVGDVAQAVAIAEFPTPPWPGIASGAAHLIARALELVPPDSLESGRLLSRYGRILGIEEGDEQGAQEAFGRALSIARREKNTSLEAVTLANAAQVDYQYSRREESVAKSERAIELARQIDAPRTELAARYWAVLSLTRLGDLGKLRRHATAILPLAEQLRDNYWLATAYWSNDLLHSLKGDWQTARDFSTKGLAAAGSDPRLLHTRVLMEYQSGNLEEGEVYLEQLVEATQPTRYGPNQEANRVAHAIIWVARITGFADRLDLAQVAAESILSSPATLQRAMGARTTLAMLVALQGDQEAAVDHYSTLQPHRGTIHAVGTTIDHILGLLAETMGRLDQALVHFEDARVSLNQAGYQPSLAWTCYDYANATLRRNGPGDHAKARTLLEEGLTISQELGMRPLAEKLVSLREKAESQPEAPPAYPDGLTQREVEVLRLVSLGKSDREIAEELFLSTRTINTHVRNILNKTAVVNRTEAATYAAHHGLI